MAWLQHLFAALILAHMVWAAVLLEKEWRRIRRPARPTNQQALASMPRAFIGADAPQATNPQ
jgi:hypothetical protein